MNEHLTSDCVPADEDAQTAWQPIETAPKDGRCLLAVMTDDGYEFAVLTRDAKGRWIHEGEPTYCAPYYYEPKFWMPLPQPPGSKQ